jgi:hypothetical protein
MILWLVGEGDNREATMATMVSEHRSSFGMNCVQCDNELVAPEWSEYRGKRHIHHLWHCWKCDFRFEIIVDTMLVTRDGFSPSLSIP